MSPTANANGADPDDRVDVAVIGAGQAGLAAAVVLGRAARSTVLIHGGPGRGEAAGHVDDGDGPAAFRQAALAELATYPSVTVVEGRVASVSGRDGDFHVRFEDGRDQRARRVVLATGVVDELPAVEGLAPLWGRTVVHCPYCHGWELRGRPTAVLLPRRPLGQQVGVLLARKVAHLSDDVAVCLDGGPPLSDDDHAVLDATGIAVWPERLARLEADGPQLRRIVFADGTIRERTALYVLPTIRQATPFAAQLGCRLLADGTIQVDRLGHTSVRGVHAVGDIAQRPRLPLPGQQAAVAAAEGVTTAITLDQELLLTPTLVVL